MLPILTIDSPILVSQNIQNTIKDKMCCLNAIGDLMHLLGSIFNEIHNYIFYHVLLNFIFHFIVY